MKKMLALTFLTLVSFVAHSQISVEAQIDSLVSNEKYAEVIDIYNQIGSNDSYEVLYNVGLSCYMIGLDEECLEMMNQALLQDSTQAAPYFIKGATYNYMGKVSDAIPLLNKAISLENDSLKLAKTYTHLGFSFNQMKEIDQSLDAYAKAMEYDKQNPLPYIMIAQIYSTKGDDANALKYYYLGEENTLPTSTEYLVILFNIGLFEQKKGDYKEAQSAFMSLLELNPTDYHAYAKLIQTYNQTKEYTNILPLKTILYDAHRNGLIKDENMSDMFCIDQFECNGVPVKVYERFEEGDSKRIYYKILFFVENGEGAIDYTIQTEYSPAAVSSKNGKYMLCASMEGIHKNYGVIFDDDTSYETIKNKVIDILEKSK